MKVVHTVLLSLLVMAAGCNSDASPQTTVAETFASRLQQTGQAWRSVEMTKAGDLTLQLVSVTQTDGILNIGVGTISGTQCVLVESLDTTANSTAVAPQLTRTLTVGTYCVRVGDDSRNLTGTADFQVRIERPF
jgi:hypothetical protein